MTEGYKRIWAFLLLGAITMFYAEVLPGSSLLWFLKLPSILITFPFYIIHAVFFLNLALKFNRKSLLSLYYLGIIYGLYETWFTTVILYGYLNKTPVFGSFIGVSIWEFMVLVFFWHPVMSFILSIATFEILSGEGNLLEGSIINSNSLSTRFIWVVLFFIGSSILSLYSGFNILVAFGSYIGSIILIYLLYYLSNRFHVLSLESLTLGNKSLFMLGALIPILYILGFYYHSNGIIVDYRAFIFIFGFYILAGALFYATKESSGKEVIDEGVNRKTLGFLYLLGAILVLVNCLLGAVIYLIDLFILLSLALVGVFIFVFSLILTVERFIWRK